MNPGSPERIIEVEPLRLPAPLVLPVPMPAPESVPVPVTVPARQVPAEVPA